MSPFDGRIVIKSTYVFSTNTLRRIWDLTQIYFGAETIGSSSRRKLQIFPLASTEPLTAVPQRLTVITKIVRIFLYSLIHSNTHGALLANNNFNLSSWISNKHNNAWLGITEVRTHTRKTRNSGLIPGPGKIFFLFEYIQCSRAVSFALTQGTLVQSSIWTILLLRFSSTLRQMLINLRKNCTQISSAVISILICLSYSRGNNPRFYI